MCEREELSYRLNKLNDCPFGYSLAEVHIFLLDAITITRTYTDTSCLHWFVNSTSVSFLFVDISNRLLLLD